VRRAKRSRRPCAGLPSGWAATSGPASRPDPPGVGYNLDQLLPENGFDLAKALVGTEGTCVTMLGATVRLVESPAARALAVLGFPDAYTAADHVMAVREHHPLTIEGMDAGLIAALRAQHPGETTSSALPEGGGWLYVETGGPPGRRPRRRRAQWRAR